MGGEDERHQELRGLALETDRHDDNDRQESGDRAVDADQGGQHGHEAHGEKEEARPALLSGAPDQQLTGPGRDSRRLKPRAHDEKAGDEDDGRIAEPAQRLPQSENLRRPQRQRCRHRDDNDRQLVPNEQDDSDCDDGGDISDRAQSLVSSSTRHLRSARWVRVPGMWRPCAPESTMSPPPPT